MDMYVQPFQEQKYQVYEDQCFCENEKKHRNWRASDNLLFFDYGPDNNDCY